VAVLEAPLVRLLHSREYVLLRSREAKTGGSAAESPSERRDELMGMKAFMLKKLLRGHGKNANSGRKPDLIEAILDAEASLHEGGGGAGSGSPMACPVESSDFNRAALIANGGSWAGTRSSTRPRPGRVSPMATAPTPPGRTAPTAPTAPTGAVHCSNAYVVVDSAGADVAKHRTLHTCVSRFVSPGDSYTFSGRASAS